MSCNVVLVIPGAELDDGARQANAGFKAFLDRSLDQSCQMLWYGAGDPWNSLAISQWLDHQEIAVGSKGIVIAFSAGVVGAAGLIGSGWLVGLSRRVKWQKVIAVDGWCVPLVLPVPVVRLSHDLETHWNGLLLGSGETQFYADPFVSHVQLWQDPDQVMGWQVRQGLSGLGAPYSPKRISAGQFLLDQVASVRGKLDHC